MNREARIFVAGHRGLVGSALIDALEAHGYENLLVRSREDLDLTDGAAVEGYFREARPQYVFMAAAKVGGILANSAYPADFIRDNLAIELNVLESARMAGVERLLFLGSSCIYPRHAPQPMKEEHLLTGPLEPTNQWYAIAKIAGLKLCQAFNRQHGTTFITAMPTNLYGPRDNFDLQTSHVLPALIHKFHCARSSSEPVTVWGSGTPRREFLYVGDLADACLHLMNLKDPPEVVNIGVGKDISISELAAKIAGIVGFEGEIQYDRTKPDGTPRKLLDVSVLQKTGWRAETDLDTGIRQTYDWFLAQPHEC